MPYGKDGDGRAEISPHLRQIDILDRAERKLIQDREHVMLKPRWREETGETPVLAAGDLEGARKFLYKIRAAITKGGWTKDERNRLKRLHRKWAKKSSGTDNWFNVNGNPETHTGKYNKYGREGWEQQQYEWKKVRKPFTP